jgi:hypothetical protein
MNMVGEFCFGSVVARKETGARLVLAAWAVATGSDWACDTCGEKWKKGGVGRLGWFGVGLGFGPLPIHRIGKSFEFLNHLQITNAFEFNPISNFKRLLLT